MPYELVTFKGHDGRNMNTKENRKQCAENNDYLFIISTGALKQKPTVQPPQKGLFIYLWECQKAVDFLKCSDWVWDNGWSKFYLLQSSLVN